jgi:hypothetical protein
MSSANDYARRRTTVDESGRLTDLRARLADAIARGDDAAEVELEAAISFVEQAEASIPAALRAALQIPYPAFFCNSQKEPTCATGYKAACQGEALKQLYRRSPGVLIGVPTGPLSGVSILDVDTPKGGDTWWDANKDSLPQTRLHETRSGGLHAVFKHREGLRNSTSKIARGIDVRGEGGYIIHWPSHGFSVVDRPLAAWPDWLRPEPEPEPARSAIAAAAPFNGASRYGASALDRACSAIRGAANGDQEATLNREAFSIGQLAAGGVLEPSGARDALLLAGRSMASYDPRRPWRPREVAEKVNRAFAQGATRPRSVPVGRFGR